MAAKNENQQRTSKLIIAGTEVNVTLDVVSIDTLRLDPDNPRIRFQINNGTHKKPTNGDELLAIVRAQPGYEDLQKQIRKQGGVHDPLIVRHDGTIVEGNTRFAVVSWLAKPDRSVTQWTTVPIMRLAQGVPERINRLLMANYHIAGKTPWRPAGQAEHIYRLIEEDKISAEVVADATRLSTKKVQQYVDAYKFLIREVVPEVEVGGKVDRKDILEKKFSHALELITRKDLAPIRADPVARKEVAKLIATDKIQGAQVRRLPSVMRSAKTKDILVKNGFNAANEALKRADPTADSKILKVIQSLTVMLKSMDQDDIELFRKYAKARRALEDLRDATQPVLEIAKPREGKRDAH